MPEKKKTCQKQLIRIAVRGASQIIRIHFCLVTKILKTSFDVKRLKIQQTLDFQLEKEIN